MLGVQLNDSKRKYRIHRIHSHFGRDFCHKIVSNCVLEMGK
jgi:hypothetical protein